MEVIFISGIFMSVFIVILLLTKKQKALTDKILAWWMAVIGMHLLGFYLNQMGYWTTYPHLVGVTAPIPLLHGPLLYLYCLYALRGDQKIRAVDYLHFVPLMLAYAYMSNFFFFYSAAEKRLVDSGQVTDFKTFSIILLVAILFSGLVYAVLSYRLTLRQKHKIEALFSDHEGISLQWLRYCILGIGFVFLSAMMVFLLRDGMGFHFAFNPELIIYTILIGFIFYLGYFGIKHENIFTNKPETGSWEQADAGTTEKYKNSGLTQELSELKYQDLLKVMEVEKPYLQPKLTLSDLAGCFEISPNQLSQIINQQAKMNFHDFVNQYRVEAFLANARKNKHYNILALAFDAGFNSKSSFNTIFKKQKGLSPTQYLAKMASQQLGE